MTKKEREFFYELGKRDFARGIPCQPNKSKELMKYAQTGKPTTAESMQELTAKMRWWSKGWTSANLAAPWG